MEKEKPKVEKKKAKVRRCVKVPVSDKDYNLLSDLKDSGRRVFNHRLQVYANMLVEKIRRGVRI